MFGFGSTWPGKPTFIELLENSRTAPYRPRSPCAFPCTLQNYFVHLLLDLRLSGH